MNEFSNSIEDFEDIYQEELNNSETNYFILDTNGDYKGEKEFETYIWETNKYGKVKEGDLFIYRRPQRASEIKNEFYFFGCGKIKKIELIEGAKVKGIIDKSIKFKEKVLQRDVQNMKWHTEKKKEGTFQNFFLQYGMNLINKKDFLEILSFNKKILEVQNESFEDENTNVNIDNEIEKKLAEKINNGNYEVKDKNATTKVRGTAQRVFSQKVKVNYQYKCAITGIETTSFLIASHIVPWSKNEKIRLDPSNGICLSSLVDKAFDQGYIAISDEYKIIFSDELKKDKQLYRELKKYENNFIKLPVEFKPNLNYLRWHRENIFKKQ